METVGPKESDERAESDESDESAESEEKAERAERAVIERKRGRACLGGRRELLGEKESPVSVK